MRASRAFPCARFLAALAAGALGGLCTPAQADELIVSAAASLTNAFRDIGKAFEVANPGDRVVTNFGASDTLLAQIAKGAPADVFASADEESMDKAEKQSLIAPGTRRDFVSNVLVLIVPADSALKLSGLDDLRAASVKRVAVGIPESVPVGRYSREALKAAGLWDTLQQKYIFTQNVRQSLDYVARGEVDAAFVYRTDAAIMKDKVKVAFTVATTTAVRYPIAIVKDSRQRPLAEAFLRYLGAEESRVTLEKYGFGRP